MSFINLQTVVVTTAADGSATFYTENVTGLLSQIRYVKASSGSFTDGVGFTITNEATGETLWAEAAVNASATRAPRQPTHTTAGVAALYAASGTGVNAPIALANHRIKIVIASGGDTKSGTFFFTLN